MWALYISCTTLTHGGVCINTELRSFYSNEKISWKVKITHFSWNYNYNYLKNFVIRTSKYGLCNSLVLMPGCLNSTFNFVCLQLSIVRLQLSIFMNWSSQPRLTAYNKNTSSHLKLMAHPHLLKTGSFLVQSL